MNENTQKLSCVHGRLRRSCDQCAADAEIQELRAALITANQENARLREAILQAWQECEDVRLTQLQFARDEAKAAKSAEDFHRWSFWQGVMGGGLTVHNIYERLKQVVQSEVTMASSCPECGADYEKTVDEPFYGPTTYWKCLSFQHHDKDHVASTLCDMRSLEKQVESLTVEVERLRQAAAPVVRWYYEDCISSTWPRPSDTRREFAALRDALNASAAKENHDAE